MVMVQEVNVKKMLKHKANVIYAVKEYHRNCDTKVSEIASSFKKTENEITNWFCEAISKGYIVSDEICKSIITKHVAEYESKHNLINSSLRLMYADAIKKRSSSLVNI